MPFDKFFSSGHKRKQSESERMAARHRLQWPEGTQKEAKIKLFMRGGGRDWWHFLDVPASCIAEELDAWREMNPGFDFRAEE